MMRIATYARVSTRDERAAAWGQNGGELGHKKVAVGLAVGHLLFRTLFCFVHLDESVSCLRGGGEHGGFRGRCIRMFESRDTDVVSQCVSIITNRDDAGEGVGVDLAGKRSTVVHSGRILLPERFTRWRASMRFSRLRNRRWRTRPGCAFGGVDPRLDA